MNGKWGKNGAGGDRNRESNKKRDREVNWDDIIAGEERAGEHARITQRCTVNGGAGS